MRVEGGSAYQTVRTRTGVRLIQHGTVLSEVRETPGPTHSVADVLAAAVHVLTRDARIALLGFAGGGLVAPLRAMGGTQAIDAVDLDESGYKMFQELCSTWAGEVAFEKADACKWLRRKGHCYSAIIEDLSVPEKDDVVKPSVTWSELPPLIHHALTANGVGIFNLLRPAQFSWASGMHRLIPKGFDSRVIYFSEYENRVLIAGKSLPTPRSLSRQLRVRLRAIRSRLATRISVRIG